VPLPPPKLDHAAPGVLSYRKEYPDSPINTDDAIETARRRHGRPINRQKSEDAVPTQSSSTAIRRKPLNSPPITTSIPQIPVVEDYSSSSLEAPPTTTPTTKSRGKTRARASSDEISPTSTTSSAEDAQAEPPPLSASSDREWERKKAHILKHLPPGIDESAAKSILNEVVVHGDEVHWSDIAGLSAAKSTLKETVVYPFLRPDLFSGLREPARGLLLFGPPGTGKTMLARAVATESKSTFFSIGAGSLVSKFLGDSEKLVRALFGLARVLSPSIIFVDEIDSLLGSRGREGEHEATRRVKTEFLIQWSDLQRAAAGREPDRDKGGGGDASRVLVLAATNLPWAIDEAARRRFVRRQYIPLPEDEVRKVQLENLLSHQKHELGERDIEKLVILTDGT
jgi:SpoVK/Ycf46/Vps4 family AAA+-type ATPase